MKNSERKWQDYGDRIKQSRKQAGFKNAVDFFHHLVDENGEPLKQSVYSHYELGKRKPFQLFEQIAELCGVTVDYLYGRSPIDKSATPTTIPARPFFGTGPRLEYNEIDEWLNNNTAPNNKEEYLMPKKAGPRTFVVQNIGRKMSPVIEHESTIYVDPDANIPNDQLVLVRFPTGKYAPRYFRLEGDEAYLETCDKSERVELSTDYQMVGAVIMVDTTRD